MPVTTKTPHAELVLNTLLYVSKTLAGGDVHSILDLGFRPDQVTRLRCLTLANLHRLARAPAHFMAVSVDPVCLDRLLTHLERAQEVENLQDELILQRAPLPMMHALYAMTAEEYSTRRKMLGMASVGLGRPPGPTPEQETTCWNVWSAHDDLDKPHRYLAVAQSTELPLCTLWSLVKSWEIADNRQEGIPRRTAHTDTTNPIDSVAHIGHAWRPGNSDHDGGL